MWCDQQCLCADDAPYILYLWKSINIHREREIARVFLLFTFACYHHQTLYFSIHFVAEVNSNLWCHSMFIYLYLLDVHIIWCVRVSCVFLVTHSICSLDWVACMVFFSLFYPLKAISCFLTFTSFILPFPFYCNVIIVCSTMVNMIKVKQQYNQFLTIIETIARG